MPSGFISFYTSEVLATQQLLGVSDQVLGLVQFSIVVPSSEEATGIREVRIYDQQGDTDNNQFSHYRYTAGIGWESVDDEADISPSELKDLVSAAPPIGRWMSGSSEEITALFSYIIGEL